MRRQTKYINISKLFPLCRLLSEELGISPRVQSSVVESLIYWWINSIEDSVRDDLRTAMLLVSRSSCSKNLAEQLADAIDERNPTLTSRTLEVLAHFPNSIDPSIRLLVRVIRATSGEDRWLAASALSRLG